MADLKISELATESPLTGTELVEVVTGGVNKKTTTQDIADLGGSSGTSIPYGATSGTNTYTIAATPAVTSYTNGMLILMRVGNSSTNVVTLNFDGVGAKKLLDTAGNQAMDGYLKAGVDYLIGYNSALDSAAGAFTVINEIKHGLMNLRGVYTASGGAYPSGGGSGPSAAIRHGDTFVVSGTDTIGSLVIRTGDLLTTIVDNPGQTASNWYWYPGPSSLAALVSDTAYDATSWNGVTTIAPSKNAVRDQVELLAPLASPTFTGTPSAPTPSVTTNTTQLQTTAGVVNKLANRSTKTSAYSIVANDNQSIITVSSGSNVNITIDQMATDYFVNVVNIGAGTVTFVAGSGVTLTGITTIPGGSFGGAFVLFTSATAASVLGTDDISYAELINKPTTVPGFLITDSVNVLNTQFATVGNVGTGDDVLFTYSVPAATLGSDGEVLRIEAVGQFAASANNKRVRVKFGATTVFDSAALAVTAAMGWTVTTKIIRTAGTTQRASTVFTYDTFIITQYATAAETLSGAITTTVNGEATSNNDVTCTFWKIKKEGI